MNRTETLTIFTKTNFYKKAVKTNDR